MYALLVPPGDTGGGDARLGVDYREIEAFVGKLSDIADNPDELGERCTKALTASFLLEALNNTPVVSGYLRRGWFRAKPSKTGADPKPGDAQKVSEKTKVKVRGKTYEATVVNNVEYAGWVDQGHRIVRDGVTIGEAPGVHYVDRIVAGAQSTAQNVVNAATNKYLKEKLNG